MLTRMYLYSTSTKLSIDVWLYLDRPGSLRLKLCPNIINFDNMNFSERRPEEVLSFSVFIKEE